MILLVKIKFHGDKSVLVCIRCEVTDELKTTIAAEADYRLLPTLGADAQMIREAFVGVAVNLTPPFSQRLEPFLHPTHRSET